MNTGRPMGGGGVFLKCTKVARPRSDCSAPFKEKFPHHGGCLLGQNKYMKFKEYTVTEVCLDIQYCNQCNIIYLTDILILQIGTSVVFCTMIGRILNAVIQTLVFLKVCV